MDFQTSSIGLEQYSERFSNVSIVRYGDTYKFIAFKRSCHCAESGGNFGINKNVNDTKLANNISRARGRVFELAMCNQWDYFVTLTLNADNIDRYDLPNAVKRFGEWVSNYNRKYKTRLKYLLVPEQHKDGAWHFHGLFDGISLESLCRNKYSYYDLPYYHNRFGFISLSEVRDHNRTASYITKYISKDMTASGVEVGKHLFFASRGLNGAERVIQGRMDSEAAHRLCTFENDFCGLAYISEQQVRRVAKEIYTTTPL